MPCRACVRSGAQPHAAVIGSMMARTSVTLLAGKPLNLAHAIPAPALARFVCEATKCSRKWRSLVDQDISRCGQWDNLGRVGAATARLRHRSRGEHEFSELLGSDVRSLISGVSVGARDWRHASE